MSVINTVDRVNELYSEGGITEVISGIKRFLAYREYKLVMWWLFKFGNNHTDAYRRLMSYRINRFGAESSVGGFEDGIGTLQFEFLKDRGLSSDDTLLDLGCGVLRGGQYFIPFLATGNYIGMDISSEAIQEGKGIIGEELIQEKEPSFIINNDLTFSEIDGTVDYIIAQSVFSHLPKSEIRECFENVDRILSTDGEFYATFSEDETVREKNFSYDPEELVDLGSECGLSVTILPKDAYPHPYNQRMLLVESE